jgi:hypothetical protein
MASVGGKPEARRPTRRREASMFGARVSGALALALALAGLVPGCTPENIDDVHKGMMFSDVETIMGQPKQVIYGEKIDADKTTWIYPQGRVLFENCMVIKVEKAGEEKSIIDRVQDRPEGR